MRDRMLNDNDLSASIASRARVRVPVMSISECATPVVVARLESEKKMKNVDHLQNWAE